MYLIEYVAMPNVQGAPVLHSELALGTTVEEARDQADSHLAAASQKFGAKGYRILGKDSVQVAVGPTSH